MARNFTVEQLIDRVRKRGDFPNTEKPSDDDIIAWLSASYGWLYALLCDAGHWPAWTEDGVAADGGKDYALDADYFRTVRVDHEVSTGCFRPLRLITENELHRFERPNAGRASGYMIQGENLILLPAPPSGQTYRHIFIPAPADLTTIADTVDGVAGWEELLVIDAAIKARIAEETDTSDLMQERAMYLSRIEHERNQRMVTGTGRVIGAFEEESSWDDDPNSRGSWE